MGYIVGTDEAGYGPNLGPLVISATVWEVPDELLGADLYQPLRQFVAANPDGEGEHPKRVAIGDSKILYRPGKGLCALEQGVLSALEMTGVRPSTWRDLWQSLCPGALVTLDAIPWYCKYDAPHPSEVTSEQLGSSAETLRKGLRSAGVRLRCIRSRAIFPECFNELVDKFGSKGEALSRSTLALVRELIEPLEVDKVHVSCDKHGGRNKYAPLLQEEFPEYLVEIHREGRAESVYRWGPRQRRVEARFVVGGDKILPSALASMVSKYLRELALRALNHFWCQHVPDLRPTAGYPTDARRFRTEIQEAQLRLGIADRVLWRNR